MDAAALADVLVRLGAERRAGEVEARVVAAAVEAAGGDGGDLRGPSGEIVHRSGPPPSGEPLVEAALPGADAPLGTLRVWGGGLGPEAPDVLRVVAVAGAQVILASRMALSARQAEARARRVGEAAADIAAGGSRNEALTRLLGRARVLFSAPLAVLLAFGRDGRLTPEILDGVVDAVDDALWAELPALPLDAIAEGRVWSGEVATGGLTRVVAVAPLAYGENRYGVLGLCGLPMPEAEQMELLDEFADRTAAAVWIAALEEEVRELSTVDPVTRLYDGRYFRQRLDQEISRAARQNEPLTVLVMAYDGSAELRAQGRDAAADDALLDLAVHVGHSRRASDVACRLAGDEVAMILPDAAGLDAVLVAERIRAAAAAAVGTARTLSVGVATFPDAGNGREELISAARSALTWAHGHGGDRAFLYDKDVAAILEAEARRNEPSDDAFLATVHALAVAVDARDPSTQEHGRNVSRIASLLAEELGLAPDHVAQVATAGLLHDVGKIGVSDRVLRKEEPLDDDDWEEIRQHPSVAHRILAGTELEPLRDWILHHHERVDGSGYPGGLEGDAIPFESRIIAVAEALDAMVQGRPYQAAVPHERALEEIAALAGTKFDPVVVAALQALAARGEPAVAPRPAP